MRPLTDFPSSEKQTPQFCGGKSTGDSYPSLSSSEIGALPLSEEGEIGGFRVSDSIFGRLLGEKLGSRVSMAGDES